MTEDRAPGDYEVGYGKPPRHTQFQPGRSGNPRGRPRGARGLRAELKAELDERVTIVEEGKSKRVRKLRVVIKALTARAAKGNVAAADKLLSLLIQAEGFEDQRPAKRALSQADQQILDRLLGVDSRAAADPLRSEVTEALSETLEETIDVSR